MNKPCNLRPAKLSLIISVIAFTILTGTLARAQESKNIAYDQPAPTIPPRLTEHSKKMMPNVYRVADNVYCAVGYALANATMVVGNDGIIIIDTTESVEAGRNILTEFRKITDKPVKAVIYTHNHSDHTGGVKAFASEADVQSGRVQIYAHESLMATVISNAAYVAPILGIRAAYTFGILLEKGPEGAVNEGLGPGFVRGETSFIAPTKTFKDRLDVEIAGIRMQLQHAPSETDDEIVVWLPQHRVLQSAEVIQGETFPNMHTIRGTKYRDPVNWFRSIDLLRRYEAAHLVPSHGRPVSGQEKVEELLTSYRDAIQYVHDQTIRNMNKGLTPDELVAVVSKLPPHLANHPWLGEFYGTVKHSVRQIYQGYLGWFEADPTFLDPLPRPERAAHYVAQMGGRDAVVKAAQAAFEQKDFQWAAEILTYVIRVNNSDLEARKIKANALRQLAYKTENINWRNWYITSARELDQQLDSTAAMRTISALASPDVLRALPVSKFFEAMTVRLDPVKSADAHLTVAFQFTDTAQGYGVEVRRGIAQVHETLPSKADATLKLTTQTLNRIIARQTTFPEAMKAGEVKAEGNLAALPKFLSFFDPPTNTPPALTVR